MPRIRSICRTTRVWVVAILAVISLLPAGAAVGISIDPESGHAAISPDIYGSNQDIAGVNFTLRRSGGNRMTGYNWENNASNAGADWFNQSDDFLIGASGIPNSQTDIPGIVLTKFHDQSLAAHAPLPIPKHRFVIPFNPHHMDLAVVLTATAGLCDHFLLSHPRFQYLLHGLPV